MNLRIFTTSLLVVFFCICTFTAHAGVKEIKARMLSRLPVIKELKARGIIGENNRGYLAYPGKKKEKKDLVAKENADRKKIYKMIAKQQGAKLALVEKHRAAQLEKKARSGQWLQDAKGKWYKKP